LRTEFHREDFAAAVFWSFTSFLVGFGRAFGGEILPQDFSWQNLYSLRLRAPHKILRRSCRGFAPALRRFLGYKARKFCCRPPHRKNFNEGGCAARAIVDGNVTLCGKNFNYNSPQKLCLKFYFARFCSIKLRRNKILSQNFTL